MNGIPVTQGIYLVETKRHENDLWEGDHYALICFGEWCWFPIGYAGQGKSPEAFEAWLAGMWKWRIVDMADVESPRAEPPVRFRWGRLAAQEMRAVQAEYGGKYSPPPEARLAMGLLAATMAQAEATNKVAEQARIANLLTVWCSFPGPHEVLREQIEQALGLS